MKDALGIVVGVVITLVALSLAITGTFMPFRDNQALLGSTNASLMTSLQSELNSSISDLTVTGSSIKSLINSSVGNSNIEIHVNSTKWDGKTYDDCNITVSSSTQYTQSTRTSNGKTIYEFTTK